MRSGVTKQEFCTAFDAYKDMIEREWQVRNSMDLAYSSNDIFSYLLDNYYELLVTFLDPTDEELEWISWFVWEIDFGASYSDGDLVVDGTEIPIWNSEDFWKFLSGDDLK